MLSWGRNGVTTKVPVNRPIGYLPKRTACWLLSATLLTACGGLGAAPPTPTPGIVGIGEKTQLGQIALTVASAERKDMIGESSSPGAGNVFLVVDVTIQSNADHK